MNQFNWLVDLLEQNDIHYWVDDGTLLGLVRDSELMDEDIDLSIWYEDKHKLTKLDKQFKKKGYKKLSKVYNGETYGYFYISENKQNIDIHCYKVESTHAWSITFAPNVEKRTTLRSYNNIHKGILTYVFINYKRVIKKEIFIPTWPVNIYHIGTRWVPLSHFDSFIQWEFDGLSVNVPKKYDEYLSLKYGDWETPVDEWSYFHDDGSRKPIRPEKLISNENQRK